MGSSVEPQGAVEARLRSAHPGSLLPAMLRGKSPCLGSESASGRLQGPGEAAGGEALRGAAALGLGRSQQHRHAVSAQRGTNRTGLTLRMPSPT